MIRDIARTYLGQHYATFLASGRPTIAVPSHDSAWAARTTRLVGVPPGTPGAVAPQLLDGIWELPDVGIDHDPQLRPMPFAFPFTESEIREIKLDESIAGDEPEGLIEDADNAARELAIRRARTRRRNPDYLAWHSAFTRLQDEVAGFEADRDDHRNQEEPRPWGITLTTGGVELTAADLVERDLDEAVAMPIAWAYLHGHEYGHHLLEAALVEDELLRHDLRAPLGDTARSHRAQDTVCRQEEAWCEAYALTQVDRAAELVGAAVDDALAIVRQRIRDGLPGYRDGADITDVHAAFRDLIRHAGGIDEKRAGRLADELCLDEGVESVPVMLIVSPRSSYEAGAWSTPHDIARLLA